MRLTSLTAYHVRIPLKHKVRHASHSRDETDSLIVRCELDNGAVGWGEGLPRPYVTGETIDSVWSLLADSDLVQQLSEPFENLAQAMALADRIKFNVADGERSFVERGCFGNSARCAVELSLLDAAARSEGVPLSRVPELLPEAFAVRESRSQVQYSAAITAMSPWATTVRAWKIRLYGFHQCKVKVGVEGVDDAELLRRIRKILPAGRVDLRIDTNEAWTCENLESKLAPLLPFDITSLEQPVPHSQVAGLAKLRGRIGIPLMLDESLCSLTDAHRAIESGTCDLFNIRLSKCGGFLSSLRLAALARQAGLGYQLGCQVGETGILSAAGRHFACSITDIRSLEGSYDRHLVREPLTRQDLTFRRRGLAASLPGPGLGVEIDQAALQRVTVRQWEQRL
ncbi:MAG: dipeptide epimerase [Planctomycetota bacterium]|nr:MAG: dipeptide epimerase [Planctomycetota bacterium]